MKTQTTIRNCDSTFRFRCPESWTNLTPTSSADVRHCATCDHDVFFCRTDEDTLLHARAGHCIARELPETYELPMIYLGKPKEEPVSTPQQKEASAWDRREQGINDAIKNIDAPRSCPHCNYPAPNWWETCRVCGFEIGRVTTLN